jgi:hypothetical protein
MKKGFKRKAATVLASLAIAATGVVLPAPASAGPTCWEQVRMECNTAWQMWGYMSPEDCTQKRACSYCPREDRDCFEIDYIQD